MDYTHIVDNGSQCIFARLIEEYDGKETSTTKGKTVSKPDPEEEKFKENALMQLEEHNTGSVSWQIYARYLENAGGVC